MNTHIYLFFVDSALLYVHIVIRTVKPIPTVSQAAKATVRDIALKSKIVEMQMKSPIFHQSKGQGMRSVKPSFDIGGMVLD